MVDRIVSSITVLASVDITSLALTKILAETPSSTGYIAGDVWRTRMGTYPGALVVHSIDQSFGTGVGTEVEMTHSEYDYWNMFDANTPHFLFIKNDRIMAVQAAFGLLGENNTTDGKQVLIRLNGQSDNQALDMQGLNPSVQPRFNGATGPILVNSGDYISLWYRHIDGSTQTLPADDRTWLAVWPIAFR